MVVLGKERNISTFRKLIAPKKVKLTSLISYFRPCPPKNLLRGRHFFLIEEKWRETFSKDSFLFEELSLVPNALKMYW